MKLKILSLAAVGAIVSATGAQAAVCSAAVSLGVTPSVDCHVGTNGQGGSGNDKAAFLNAESVFGQTDWGQIAKDNDLNGTDEGNASALTVTGSLLTGTIDIANFVFSTYSTVSVVLKSGGGNATPDKWVAYEVQDILGLYAYTSIFLNNNNGSQKNLSHITLYGSVGDDNNMTPVPLPAAGWLLLAGLGGLGAMSRRKKS